MTSAFDCTIYLTDRVLCFLKADILPDCSLDNGLEFCYVANGTQQQCLPGNYESGAALLGNLSFDHSSALHAVLSQLPYGLQHQYDFLWRLCRILTIQSLNLLDPLSTVLTGIELLREMCKLSGMHTLFGSAAEQHAAYAGHRFHSLHSSG